MRTLLNAFRGAFTAQLRGAYLRHVSRYPFRRAFSGSRRVLAASEPSAAQSVKPFAGQAKSFYPERLLIYNAGTGKTFIISAIKLTSVFIFAGSCLVIAPVYYKDPVSPSWVPVAVICFGAAPMLIYAFATAPFVNSVYLFVPHYARRSGDTAMRYAKNLPPDARLELLTLRLVGLPKTTGVKLSELKPYKPRFGFANLVRVASGRDRQVTGWRGWMRRLDEPRNKFYVTSDEQVMKRSRLPGIWKHVLEAIERNR